jgi:hypothetical protein
LMFRNERKLYKRTCDATWDTIISIYSPDKPYKVYKQDFRWSDKRDPMEYGVDFDYGKSFTEQFGGLMVRVPHMSLFNPWSENCDYTNILLNAKNCYLCFVSSFSENCMHTHWSLAWNNVVDAYRWNNLSDSYEINWWKDAANCFYCYDIEQCNNCYFSIWLVWCDSCVLCSNLVNKKYCINNKQYTKEEFEKTLKWLDYDKSLWLRKGLQKTSLKTAIKNYHSEAVFWSGNMNSKNLVFCSNLIEGSDCRYFDEWASWFVDCIDGNYGYGSSLCYESLSISLWKQSISTIFTKETEKCLFSVNLFTCSNCFWCIWLRNKSYCIFNKQYTKEEYETEVAKIIDHMQITGEWWEFFDPSLSPFGYNETVAQEYFPLLQTEAEKRWYKRQVNNYDPVIPEWAKVVDWKTWWEAPKEDQQILRSIFVCEVSWRPYRIIQQELEFYRKHDLPLPRKHPDVRHEDRLKLRPWRTLYLRKCDKIGEEMVSVYPPDYQGKVYSEKAYQEEIYG